MPSDDIIWAGIVFTGLSILVTYYVVVWARSIRKQLTRVDDSYRALESQFTAIRSDVGMVGRELSSKVSSAELDSYCAAFAASAARKNKMVMKRG